MGKINYNKLILRLKNLIEDYFKENPLDLGSNQLTKVENDSQLNNLVNKLLMNYDKINGINYSNFFYTDNPNNKKLHDSIIAIITDEFSKAPNEQFSQIEFDKEIQNLNLTYDIVQFFDIYLLTFIDNGFIKLNNQTNPIEHLMFNPNSTPVYYHAKRKCNIAKNLAGIILEDGTILMSPTIHLDLIMYLCVNGIDIKKAIKIEQMDDSNEFNISTMCNYEYVLKFPIKKSITLSKEQSKAITTLYQKINIMKKL